MLIAAALTFLALLVAAIGVRLAGRTRRPRLFRSAAILAAIGLILLWVLPWWALSRQAGEGSMQIFVAALFFAISTLGAGLTLMARAATGQTDSEVDRIIQNFDPYDELP